MSSANGRYVVRRAASGFEVWFETDEMPRWAKQVAFFFDEDRAESYASLENDLLKYYEEDSLTPQDIADGTSDPPPYSDARARWRDMLTDKQWLVLETIHKIHERGQQITYQELRTQTRLKHGSITYFIDTLEKKGLIRREGSDGTAPIVVPARAEFRGEKMWPSVKTEGAAPDRQTPVLSAARCDTITEISPASHHTSNDSTSSASAEEKGHFQRDASGVMRWVENDEDDG